jgi:hypothetical protein
MPLALKARAEFLGISDPLKNLFIKKDFLVLRERIRKF